LEDGCLIVCYETGITETTHTKTAAGNERKLGGANAPYGAAV
jgi:hypothetical protein